MNKIKVFLGAYINQTNAQNLNCRVLAEHIDKNRFEVLTLTIKHGNLGNIRIPGVRLFKCRYPVKITQYLGFLWGIMNSDIAYLPRGNDFELQRFFTRLFRRKSFKTVENVIDRESLSTALSALGKIDRVIENYSFVSRTYSITSFMRKYNLDEHGLLSSPVILPPVIDTIFFDQIYSQKQALSDIVFLSNDMRRKRVDEFISLAEDFSGLKFHIIGRDGGYLETLLKGRELSNVLIHGMLTHEEMLLVLQRAQLHILTSRSEGFPKGIIECAAAGIPSIVYDDYGASEWIENDKSGFVCESLEEMRMVLQRLLEEPSLLKTTSKGAKRMSEIYSADSVTKRYEKEMISLYNE